MTGLYGVIQDDRGEELGVYPCCIVMGVFVEL